MHQAIVMLAALALLAGCPDDGGNTCPAGAENCKCKSDDSCDGALVCEDGFCVAATCPEGSEGCACYANGTCDAKGGVPMTCNANVCEAASCTPGTLGCGCDAGACGGGLVCEAGMCVADACPAGTLDCACGSGDSCNAGLVCDGGTCKSDTCSAGTLGCACDTGDVCGTGLLCQDGACVADPGCPSGTLGCACGAGQTCGNGLQCEASVCAIAPGVGLKIAEGEVRACGLVIEQADVRVSFGDSVIGRVKRDGARLAIAFTAKADESLADGFATIIGSNGLPADVSAITAKQVSCFDRKGVAVGAPGLTLQ